MDILAALGIEERGPTDADCGKDRLSFRDRIRETCLNKPRADRVIDA
jgi:hypothetical protein